MKKDGYVIFPFSEEIKVFKSVFITNPNPTVIFN